MNAAQKIEEKLKKSPINYFSDLFVVAMVVAWIIVIIVMMAAAIYALILYADTSIWTEVGTLVAVPLTAGGAIWMVKNSVQHAIAYSKGKTAKEDFPRVEGAEDIEIEEEITKQEAKG